MLKDMGHPFGKGEPVYDITFENVQAGMRTDYLFRLANHHGGIVIGTGDLSELAQALDYFYPARLAMLAAWKRNWLATTPLRETLNRQSGMYRIAAKISDEQIDDVVGRFCRSDGGCLRTILWKRDASGTIPSAKLPPEKFDRAHDQTGRGERVIPLLCQEACNLLVAECREAVKGKDEL